MELTSILSDFFMRNGDCFTLPPNTSRFYGRLSARDKSSKGNKVVAPLGQGISGEYELVFPAVDGLTITKGMTISCVGKKFIATVINEYTLNDMLLYYHAFLREVKSEI